MINNIYKKYYKYYWGNTLLCSGCAVIIFLSIFLHITDIAAAESEKFEKASQTEEMLLTGLMDFTLLINNTAGSIEGIALGDEFPEKVVLTGRTAFFLKGKIKGKYLLTAKLDTGRDKLSKIWQDIFSQDTGSTISRISPERYYPVYGDDSTVVNMVPNQGKLYVDLSWDRTELLWGNYTFNNNKNGLIKYNRSLYGFKFNKTTGNKPEKNRPEVKTGLKGFWSSPASVHVYNELKIVGGMLYYLKHGNLIVGSDNIKVEIRDKLTGEVEESIQLTAGIDYDIDYLSGRLILKSPLNDYLFAEGDETLSYLITDYEYEPVTETAEQSGYGVSIDLNYRNANINSTYTTEAADDGGRYEARGIRYNYINEGHNLEVEWANTQNKLANQYLSEDGGLTYSLMTDPESVDSANAYHVRYQTVLKNKDSKDTDSAGINMTAAYSHKDKGFSSQQSNLEEDTDSYKLEFKGGNQRLSYLTRYYREIKEESGQKSTVDLKVSKEMTARLKLAGELRQTDKVDKESSTSSQLSTGLDFAYQIDGNIEIYGSQDLSLNGAPLNKTTLGAKLKPQDNITLDAAVFLDNIGQSGNDKFKVGGSYRYKNGELYSNYTAGTAGGSTLLLGGNTDLNKNTDLYVEHKNTSDTAENSDSNVFGVNYRLNDNWSLALDYTRSNVTREDDSKLTRDIITPAVVYRGDDMAYQAKMEYRKDHGDQEITQFVYTAELDKQYNKAISLLFKLDYSLTQRDGDVDEDDSFTEAQLGLAYRPIDNDRLNLLAMYTYQEEYSPEDQENVSEYNERSRIFSIEGIYDINSRWQLGEKLAWKKSQLLENGFTAVSDTYLWLNRLNYIIDEEWDVFGEYRLLQTTPSEDSKSGFLLGVNRDLDKNTQLGVGYNFTDFNDDLTDLDYSHHGLFINLVRRW